MWALTKNRNMIINLNAFRSVSLEPTTSSTRVVTNWQNGERLILATCSTEVEAMKIMKRIYEAMEQGDTLCRLEV